jgi:polysaccharide export outer membrane protein
MVQDSTSPGESLDKPAESSSEAIAPSAATPTVTTGDVLPPEKVATAPEASLAVATDERALSTVPGRVEPAPTFDDAVKPATHRKPVLNALVIPEPSAGVPTKAQHIIQIGDELDVAFPYQPIVGDATMQRLQPPLFRTERVVVREDGMIVLPLIEPVLAAGLTPEDVRAELVDRYLPFQYDPLANRKGSGERHYRICVNDEVDIRVRNQPDLDDVVTVRPDGKISVPRVGSVLAEGKTIEELESELRDSLEKVVAQPEVSVSLRQFHSDIYYEGETMKRIGLKNLEGISVIVRTAERRVYVMGEVKGAGQIPYRGTMTLNQAIASAGGTMRTAKLKEVKIVRQVGLHQPPQTILVDLRSTIRGRGVQDMDLQHLDVVVVGKTPIARFTDTLEQYLFNIVPFTRNNPNFNLFYSLGGGANPAAIVSPSP